MKFIEEVWRPVKGYEGIYEVSNIGKVKSCERIVIRSNGRKINFPEKIMKPSINHKGYEVIDLRKNGKRECGFVHRLVGKAFIENPNNKKQINHKNGIKTDNDVRNLEWVTNQENMIHAYKNGLKDNKKASESRKRKIDQLTLEGDFIKSYNSINDATKYTNAKNISGVCRGVRNKSGGFKWRYSTEIGGDSDVSK